MSVLPVVHTWATEPYALAEDVKLRGPNRFVNTCAELALVVKGIMKPNGL